MPAGAELDRLARLAPAAAERPGWAGLADYLRLRGSGRRREALAALAAFVDRAEAWPFGERLALLRWVEEQQRGGPAHTLLRPEPLWRRILAPTAAQWVARDPRSADAHRTAATFAPPGQAAMDGLRRAMALDPADGAARRLFVERVVALVGSAQHELPWHGYLGDAAEDERDLLDALEAVAGVAETVRDRLASRLTRQLETVRAWRSTAPDAFAAWYEARAADGDARVD